MAGPNRGMPGTHRYTQADLRPTLRDPRCSPQFPLACYWPVYLGNFWCDVYPQHATRIQEYFGSKGLLVRMVFARNEYLDPYFKEQKRCKCYDFLVYFVSQQDAQDAVYFCNRDMYYGHRLNVLPGRTPVFFDTSVSVRHSLLQPAKLEMAEQAFERHIYHICKARMQCIVKQSRSDLLVEYFSNEDRTLALQYCKIATPEQISMDQPKQRFLESDVQKELMAQIQGNPKFMDMLPPGNILQALMNGFLPQSTMSWKTLSMVPHIKKIRVFGPGKRRRQLRQQIYEKTQDIFGVEVDKQFPISEEVRQSKMQRKLELLHQKRTAPYGRNNF
ncbi:AAEL012018-PA [Aedes aegypti]|uniref:AAEL012018-PA n=2 Tax=Aedes aegypti TaxID=7159 RepID=A0A1S4FV03_AEDAE|nr:uncharacterized protein LOC5575710 isoform X2 [Aedes aegypti]EAT35852.1 AAEL012018-PA [Aedes aegypti]